VVEKLGGVPPPPVPPPPVQAVEKLHVYGAAIFAPVGSATLFTVTVMAPEGNAELGVSTTWVGVAPVLIFTATAPLGPLTARFAAMSVEASGALSKVMVIAVVSLTQVALFAGLTELTVSAAEVSGEEPVEVAELGLLIGVLLQPVNTSVARASVATKAGKEDAMRWRRSMENLLNVDERFLRRSVADRARSLRDPHTSFEPNEAATEKSKR
jgi:hypothetical protein